MNLDQLTARERDQLTDKLASAGTKFFTVAHLIGRTALDRVPFGPGRDWLFEQRQPYVDAMLEIHELAEAARNGSI